MERQLKFDINFTAIRHCELHEMHWIPAVGMTEEQSSCPWCQRDKLEDQISLYNPTTTYITADSETYNAGRSEGHADIAVELRKIVDPEDKKHLNLTGSLKEVERLIEYKQKAHEVITYIREADALKEFAYSNDDGPSIAELLRECYYLGEGYKDNLK